MWRIWVCETDDVCPAAGHQSEQLDLRRVRVGQLVDVHEPAARPLRRE
jgi:hypothetical protein